MCQPVNWYFQPTLLCGFITGKAKWALASVALLGVVPCTKRSLVPFPEYIPCFLARSPLGGVQEAADQCFTLQCFSPFPFLSLKSIKTYLGGKKQSEVILKKYWSSFLTPDRKENKNWVTRIAIQIEALLSQESLHCGDLNSSVQSLSCHELSLKSNWVGSLSSFTGLDRKKS